LDSAWINIGYIRKPHGLRGNVRVESLSDVPFRFDDLDNITLELPGGLRESRAIEYCKPDGAHWLMKLLGIDTPEQAHHLRGAYIQVTADNAATLPDGAYYIFEVVGCTVVTTNGKEIGVLKEVMPLPANDVFVVNTRDGEALIPAIRDVVAAVNLEDGKIVIRPMPGLFE